MRNIEELNLEETCFDIFEKIIDLKHEPNKSTLDWLKLEIKDCYKEYDCKKGDLFSIWNKWYEGNNKKALLNCYTSKTLFTSNLKKNIRKLWNRKCPYCNIEYSVQVEHYIPKEDFSEFSFLIQNLIPSCSTCNGKKWTKWKDDKTRLFLNAYFDIIPEEQFLFIELFLEDWIPQSNFYIDISSIVIDEKIEVILNKHVKKLNLLERYNEEINEIITELKSSKPNSIDDLINIIQYTIRIWNWYWNNYWKNILYKEISENEKILNFIIID